MAALDTHPYFQHFLRLLCGCLTGATVKTFIAPIERVKFLFETQTMFVPPEQRKYTKIYKTVVSVAKTEGFTGFFRGNLTNLLRIVPSAGIKLATFDMYKVTSARWFPAASSWNIFLSSFIAGSFSGATQVVIAYPLDVVRTRLMQAGNYEGIWHCIKTTWQQEGLTAFYKGMPLSIFGVAVYVGISLGMYDFFKRVSHTNSSLKKVIVAALTAAAASSITFPSGIVKKRIQLQGSLHHPSSKYRGYIDCFATIFRTEGIGGLYRGYSLQVFRSVPGTSLSFVTYDILKRWFGLS